MRKQTILFLMALFTTVAVNAQKAWVVPEMFNPGDSVTLYADVSKCDCQRLLNTQEDVYMWAFNPGDPVIGNGDWTASNPNMIMQRDPNNQNIYFMKIVPNEFFAITSDAEIYAKGFSYLLKLADGTGDGGGGCDEDKTEDLNVDAIPIPGCNSKFCQFPQNYYQDDFFTFIYNNELEEKPTMDESVVGEDNFYIYPAVYFKDGSPPQRYVNGYANVVNHPELQLMKDPEDGNYKITFLPSDFWIHVNPDNKEIDYMTFEVMNVNYSGPDDVSDGNFVSYVGCQ